VKSVLFFVQLRFLVITPISPAQGWSEKNSRKHVCSPIDSLISRSRSTNSPESGLQTFDYTRRRRSLRIAIL